MQKPNPDNVKNGVLFYTVRHWFYQKCSQLLPPQPKKQKNDSEESTFCPMITSFVPLIHYQNERLGFYTFF